MSWRRGAAKTAPLVDLIGKFTAEAAKQDGNLDRGGRSGAT